ncbi:MAG: aminotransferase class III-fold pyridoxal phosphate-dependent enzyme [Gallionella sp.]|nr:aminotransferase class III-fold pyridoxal phosphate-dependent enzyme [Gallionella sp.]
MQDNAMVNAYKPGLVSLPADELAMIERRKRLLGPAYRLLYQHPVHVVRGQGVWLYDTDGQAYLDMYNNVASVGHCHPHVVRAMAAQAAMLSTNTRYLHDTILQYSERLLAKFPPHLGHLMFTCTGSEANDLAIRATCAYTGATGLIVTECAYHGITKAVSEISPSLGRNVDLGVHVRTVPAPDLYRSPGSDVAAELRRNVEEAIADLRRHGIKPAAFICDSIFSSDGVFAEPAGFLAGAVGAIHAAGGLYIADEVQPGFGRTGGHMWGFQRHGVLPDIVTLGKPMGNGYPVAAMVVRPEVVAEFGANARYFNTFGGNTVAVATAMAVLDVIENEGLMLNAADTGAYLHAGLQSLSQEFEALGDVRSAGLFFGVEVVSDRAAKTPDAAFTNQLVNDLRERRVLISATGPRANVLKIRPPLVFNRSDADFFIEQLREVLLFNATSKG